MQKGNEDSGRAVWGLGQELLLQMSWIHETESWHQLSSDPTPPGAKDSPTEKPYVSPGLQYPGAEYPTPSFLGQSSIITGFLKNKRLNAGSLSQKDLQQPEEPGLETRWPAPVRGAWACELLS